MTHQLTSLESRLASPDGGALRDELMRRLQSMEQGLRERVDAGLLRDEFLQCQALATAVATAQEVLSTWPVGDTLSTTPVVTSVVSPSR